MSKNINTSVEKLRILDEECKKLYPSTTRTCLSNRYNSMKAKIQEQELLLLCILLAQTISLGSLVSFK